MVGVEAADDHTRMQPHLRNLEVRPPYSSACSRLPAANQMRLPLRSILTSTNRFGPIVLTALNAAVHIPAHERIRRGMCLHSLADCEVVCVWLELEQWDRVSVAMATSSVLSWLG